MQNMISNILVLLVVAMIGLTGYSIISGKVFMIPYIQIVFALVLVTWGTIEYKEEGKKASFLYFGLAFIALVAAIFNFLK